MTGNGESLDTTSNIHEVIEPASVHPTLTVDVADEYSSIKCAWIAWACGWRGPSAEASRR